MSLQTSTITVQLFSKKREENKKKLTFVVKKITFFVENKTLTDSGWVYTSIELEKPLMNDENFQGLLRCDAELNIF